MAQGISKTVFQRLCKKCDTPFETYYTNQQYCSKECSKYVSKENLRKRCNQFIIFTRDGFRCFYCNKSSFSENVKLVIDHVVPRSLIVNDRADNLVTACYECNAAKHKKQFDKTLLEQIKLEIKNRNKKHNIFDSTIITGSHTKKRPSDKH